MGSAVAVSSLVSALYSDRSVVLVGPKAVYIDIITKFQGPSDDEEYALALKIAETIHALPVHPPSMLRQSETAWISWMGQMEEETKTRHQQWRCRAVPRAADASTFSPSVNQCLLGSELAGL